MMSTIITGDELNALVWIVKQVYMPTRNVHGYTFEKCNQEVVVIHAPVSMGKTVDLLRSMVHTPPEAAEAIEKHFWDLL